VIGGPLAGATDPALQVALLFAQKTAPVARRFVRVRELEAAITAAQTAAEAAAIAASRAESDHGQKATALAVVEDRPIQWPKWMPLTAGGAGLGLGSLMVLAAAALFSQSAVLGVLCLLVGIPGGLIGLGGAFILFGKHRAESQQNTLDRLDAEQHEGQARAALNAAREAAQARKEELAALATELATTRPQEETFSVGWVYYPLEVTEIAGSRVLLDRLAGQETVSLDAPDLAADGEALLRIDELLEESRDPPVLLSRDEGAGEGLQALIGEERVLREAVDHYVSLVESVPVFRRELPLVPAGAGATRIVSEVAPAKKTAPGARLPVADRREVQDALVVLSRVREASQARDADRRLRTVYGELGEQLTEYTSLRESALDMLHEGLLEDLQRASLLSQVYYCPRCNRIPAYLYHLIGTTPEEAHTEDQMALIARIKGDEAAAARIETQRRLVPTLLGCHHRITLLQQRTGGGSDCREDRRLDERYRQQEALDEQLAQELAEYRATLSEMLTGSRRPMVDLQRNARLVKDPVHETWSCPMCGEIFHDAALIATGRISRLRDEIVVPMWNHLWVEQERFCRSERFRTEEELRRMAEKEGEKLLAIGRTYSDDMRPVRAKLAELINQAESRRNKLFDTIEGLVQMGLMEAERAAEVRARVSEQLTGDLRQYKIAAEEKERLLSDEPGEQLRRRSGAVDPVQQIMDPAKLFQPTPTGPAPRLLSDKARR